MRDGLIIWARLQAVAASLINSGISSEQAAWEAVRCVEAEHPNSGPIKLLTAEERKAELDSRYWREKELLKAQRAALNAALELSRCVANKVDDPKVSILRTRFEVLARRAT